MPRVCPALVPTCRVPRVLPRVQAEHSWGQVVYSKFLAPATAVNGFCWKNSSIFFALKTQ